MLLTEDYTALASAQGRPIKWEGARGSRNGGGEGDCRICALARLAGGDGGELAGGSSHESEHDLALMVSDFMENHGSSGTESRYSSDSDSGLSDLKHLAERVLFFKHTMDQHEIDLSSTVRSILLSIMEMDVHFFNHGQCNASCILQLLVKRLRVSGYDAAVCLSKWQGSCKVPGGDHEYVDVILDGKIEDSDRLIVDIDFHSHFEIARAVKSYDAILTSLPVVYVGSLTRLQQLLQLMVEAAKCSLNQNSMPLPPWRSLAYLQAKWQSKYERKHSLEGLSSSHSSCSDHTQCIEHLRRLRVSVQSEIGTERLLKPIINEKKRRGRLEGPWRSLLSS